MKKYSKYIIALVSVILFFTVICFIPIGITHLVPVIEQEVSNELGVKVHIEKLILRLGPHIKVKTPIMHVIYPDGQKFAQFDGVKFYISWKSILKKSPVICHINANNVTIRLNSDDNYLPELLKKLEEKPFSETPSLDFNSYKFSYLNKETNDIYAFKGQDLHTSKLIKYKNYKLRTNGEFFINDKKHLFYDISVFPKLMMPKSEDIKCDININDLINDIKKLDFDADFVSDIKLTKKSNGAIHASGFVNIDNMSIKDASNKSPKSFIYLTFLGDKTSIKSNIYASEDKKVYTEGLIDNSDKPSVDLKVKTDEINLSDLYKKLRVISLFSVFKNINNIEGTVSANFTLKGDLNKIKSNGFMKINNAGIDSTGIKINKINSDINFANNVISIINATGYVKNSPVLLKGTIDKNVDLELLMNKVDLKYLLPESYGVKKGVISLLANITGTLDNIAHKENLSINDFNMQNDDYSLSFEALKFDTNKSNTAYINNILFTNNITEQIKIPSMKLQVEKSLIKLPETAVYMPNSKLSAKAEVLNYSGNDLVFNSTLNGYVYSKDIKALNMFSTRYPLLISLGGNKLCRNLDGQILLEQTNVLDEPSIINLSSKIDNKSVKIDDLSVSSFSGTFMNDFKSNLKGIKKVIVTGSIDNFKSPSFKNFRVFVPQQLSLHYADTIAQLKGDIFLNGAVKTPELVGQVLVANLINQGSQLMLSNSSIDFNKNIASLNAPLLKIGDSSMVLNAAFDTNVSKMLNVKSANIKAKYVNTDTLLMYKDSPLMKIIPIKVSDCKFYSDRLMASLYGSDVYLSQVNSDIKMENDILLMKNLSAEIYNGKIAGDINFNIKDESFKSKIAGRGISAAPIFDMVMTKKDTVSGTVDFDTELSGMLSLKSTLEGDIKFLAHNGRMGMLGKLEHLLYAQNVVDDNMLRTSLSVVTKAIALKDTGLFKYLRGDISLNKGIADIKMLQSQGPLMALFIKGQYNIMNDYGRLIVLGRLSDEVMSGLGAFGDFSVNKLMIMLTGEENNKYNIMPEDYDKIPQLPMRNTKEFRAVINGVVDKPSSVVLFNWISYSQKSYRQKDVSTSNVKVPSFVDEMPY